MMSPIKLRVWSPENKKIIFPGDSVNEKSITAGQIIDWFPAENIMFSTGLFDKNGKEIYKGDILQSMSALNEPCISVVKWDEKAALFRGSVFFDGTYTRIKNGTQMQADFFQHTEIIGNIFENSNLIK